MYGPLSEAGAYLPWKLIANGISAISTRSKTERRAFRWKFFYGPVIQKLDQHYDVALAYISGEILYFVDEKVDADRKIVWIHNDYNSAGHPRKYDYPHLKNMSAIVSISEQCVNIMKQEFPEFSDKIFMLENITSSNIIRKRALEFKPEEYQEDCMILLSIGRLNEQKGFDLAIKAASILKGEGLDFCWFVIGDGDLRDALIKQIKENDLSESFVLLGVKENPYPYIMNCSIFVQPSRFEGKSVVLDEAKILARPIVVTAYPTVRDQIVNGQEGLITELSPEAIAASLRKMIDNPDLREHISHYLAAHDYGNQEEIKKYTALIDGYP